MIRIMQEDAKRSQKSLKKTQGQNNEDWQLGHLKPEEKVALMMDMTSACVRICADGIRAQNPSISDEKLLVKLRERLEWPNRNRIHEGKS
jgi:hypothetical protein